MRRIWLAALTALIVFAILLGVRTWQFIEPVPESLCLDPADIRKIQIRDRHGLPLSVTYANTFNYHDFVPLHRIPAPLRQAFILSEDKRFYRHHGVDWLARLCALGQNIRALRAVRGASTLSEQVVRILHPRPRTVWSRWVEGFEATRLEKRFNKDQILEFYLNQVPFAARRRGVLQAGRYYFNRDLDTLSTGEMLALAVMVRAPSRFDLKSGNDTLMKSVKHISLRMIKAGLISEAEAQAAWRQSPTLSRISAEAQANHFVRYIYHRGFSPAPSMEGKLDTTLDTGLQSRVQSILDQRMKELKPRHVLNGAVLVLDHHTSDVLAWVNAGNFSPEVPGSRIDAVVTPRQPGSTLKPFLYASALEKGWTSATLIDDSPLTGQTGEGQHAFHNYSRQHYGLLRLRDCLGNSLNVPAIRTIQFIGHNDFLQHLHLLGFVSLNRDAGFYGNGLALGNGEVTLLELVTAYATLARQGLYRPPSFILGQDASNPRRIYSPQIASIIADILSDPKARALEFGFDNLLQLPMQTAVKTGTSTDYCDAWAMGFSHRYVVGVWMGNLDRRPMQGITGSIGPALVMRSVFAELHRHFDGRTLELSPRLVSVKICQITGMRAHADCPSMFEWFIDGRTPKTICAMHSNKPGHKLTGAHDTSFPVQLIQPTPGLRLAMDPRIPDDVEAFPLQLPKHLDIEKTKWQVDGKTIGATSRNIHRFLWQLERGRHIAQAQVWLHGKTNPIETPPVEFIVK